MAFNLNSLLQVIGGQTPQPVVDPNSIAVTAAPSPQATPQDVQPGLQSLMASPQQIQGRRPLEGLDEHKGMFGTKGTLRDVLGLLGDSLLGGSGADLIYTPQRQKERLSDAMVGFTGSPKEQLEAIQRVAALDPIRGQQLWQQYNAQQNAIDDREVQKMGREVTANKEARMRRKEGGQIYAQALAGMNEGNYDTKALEEIADEYGLGAAYDPPANYDKNLATRLIAAGTPRSTQVSEAAGGARLAQQRDIEEMKEAGRNKRYTPPQPRAGSNPTAASIAAPILAKAQRGEALTPGEQDVLTRTGFPSNRGQSGKKPSLVDQLRGNTQTTGGGKFSPGQIVTKGGKRYKVNADGKTATPL